jgi:hypothetical protein
LAADLGEPSDAPDRFRAAIARIPREGGESGVSGTREAPPPMLVQVIQGESVTGTPCVYCTSDYQIRRSHCTQKKIVRIINYLNNYLQIKIAYNIALSTLFTLFLPSCAPFWNVAGFDRGGGRALKAKSRRNIRLEIVLCSEINDIYLP